MKILFFIDNLGAGGKERRLVELMKVLSSNPEIKFELVVMSHIAHYEAVKSIQVKTHYLIRKTKKDLWVFHKLYKLCKAINPDIIHSWDSMTAVYSAPICKILQIPFINGMVSNTPTNWNICNKNWIRAKFTFPLSSYIIGNSKAGISAYKAPLKKSLVIQNGFNFNRIKNIEDRITILKRINVETKYVVGMVASYSKAKDYKTYISAANLILDKRKDVSFIAMGYQTDSDGLKSMISSDRLQYFKFLGIKSDIESYVNAMDICVLSTFTEGISNSILEYMALSKPVIATDGGGTNELLIDQKTGFLVKVSDPEDIYNRLSLLLEDEFLRLNLGLAGKQRIEKEFTIDIMMNKYISLYKAIISKNPVD